MALMTWGCEGTVTQGNGSGGDTSQGDGLNGDGVNADGLSGDVDNDLTLPPSLVGLTAIRIEPQDKTLIVTPQAPATQQYTVYGTFDDKPEADITSEVVLHVQEPSLGLFIGAKFQSVTTHGGETMVHAGVGPFSVSTPLHLKFVSNALGPETSNPLPTAPWTVFAGADTSPGLAPQLVYPNDGVMLPPNVAQLEVHWRPSGGADLFELGFHHAALDLNIYIRCTEPTSGGCVHKLEPDTYRQLAETTDGLGPVQLTIRASDEAGGLGSSATFDVEFAQEAVEGGVYYWTTSDGTAIMRFDFGDAEPNPEVFVTANDDRLDTCVGCHALSRDGKKMVMSKGGQNDGRIVFLSDVTRPENFDLNVPNQDDQDLLIQFAAWNPDGTRFAAIYGDVDNESQRNRVHFHDGNTGLRLNESIDLPFEPSHIEWSPDGKMLAMSRVGTHQTSQRPFNCGLEVMRKQGNSFGAPETVIPIQPGVNHFNPNFAPDSSFMVFSRSVCPNGDDENDECDGDSDLYAQTYAVQPQPGATPVFLARGGGPGVEDQGNKNLSDTFPRFSPFAKRQGAGRLVWVTVSSRRRFGLRGNGQRQLLWMFAIDRDRDAGRPGRELSGVLRALSGLWYVESHRAVDGRGDAVHSVAGSASTDGGLWRGRALTRQGFA